MKRIIIIGATSGIGLEVARCYLKDGWQVGVAGTDHCDIPLSGRKAF